MTPTSTTPTTPTTPTMMTARKLITSVLSTSLVCGLGVPGVAFAAGRTDVVGVLAASRVVGGPQATVEVSVDLGGGDDDIVAKRLTDEVRGVLEGKGVAMTEGYEQSKVDVSVRWDADDNHEIVVKVTNRGEATQTVEGSPFVCEACGENELVAKIREVVTGAVPLLKTDEGGGTAGGGDDGGGDDGAADDGGGDDGGSTDKPRKMGAIGGAGIGLMVLGAGAVAGGSVLVAMGEKRVDDPADPQRGDTTDFRPPGIAVLAAGSVVLIAGIGMLVGDRVAARRKRVSVTPSASPRFTGLTVQGRF